MISTSVPAETRLILTWVIPFILILDSSVTNRWTGFAL